MQETFQEGGCVSNVVRATIIEEECGDGGGRGVVECCDVEFEEVEE